jgi:hypothetical protein
MHDVRTRMEGLHHLLTGGTVHPTERRASPPRRLWGDLGLPEGRPHSSRRSRPARLLRW